MPIDTQEIIALGIVAIVVAIALLRHFRKRKQSSCDSCKGNSANKSSANGAAKKESTIHFIKKRPG